MNSASVCSRGLRRLLWLGLLAFTSLVGGSLYATGILIQTSAGGPLQYNGGGGFAWSVAFEFPEAVRVQAIQGWMTSYQAGNTAAVGIFSSLPPDPFLPGLDLKTFSLIPIDVPPPPQLVPPGRWEGVGSLNWDFEPGVYSIVFEGAFMPYGYGGPETSGPEPFVNYQTFYDGGWHDNGGPIGLRIYGTPLSAIPEPATYGLVGSAMLLGVAAFRRYRRRGANTVSV